MRALLLLPLLLCGCITAPVATPRGPGIGVQDSSDRTGFKLTQAKHDHLIKMGVPSAWMTPYPDTAYPWYISQENEGYAYDILQKDRNP